MNVAYWLPLHGLLSLLLYTNLDCRPGVAPPVVGSGPPTLSLIKKIPPPRLAYRWPDGSIVPTEFLFLYTSS